MTHDDVINHVTTLYRRINPRYHHGNQLLIRQNTVKIANDLKKAAEQVAITEAHPAWRIYQEFTKGMTRAELKQSTKEQSNLIT